jgi:RIO-like serine/threonine protein kinase
MYGWWTCYGKDNKRYGIMVSEKLDIDLADYTDSFSLTTEDYEEIEEIIHKMHSIGIAHLDLKHMNIMIKYGAMKKSSKRSGTVEREKRFYLIDFGFAIRIGEDEPFSSYDLSRMVKYYRQRYEDCFTKKDEALVMALKDPRVIKMREMGGESTDPRHIDDRFLCSLKKEISGSTAHSFGGSSGEKSSKRRK